MGRREIEWLEGERFLIYRSSYDHPDIPDGISIIGETDGLQMHYFDTRGVHRVYEVTATDEGWDMAMDREAPASLFASPEERFSQRMSFTFENNDRTIAGKGKLSHDNVIWEDDLQITYRRAPEHQDMPSAFHQMMRDDRDHRLRVRHRRRVAVAGISRHLRIHRNGHGRRDTVGRARAELGCRAADLPRILGAADIRELASRRLVFNAVASAFHDMMRDDRERRSQSRRWAAIANVSTRPPSGIATSDF